MDNDIMVQRGYRGSIEDFPGADPLRDAKVLGKAMKGFGKCFCIFDQHVFCTVYAT